MKHVKNTKILLVSLALLLSSCAGKTSLQIANKAAILDESSLAPEDDSFTLSDTVSYVSPYGNYSVREINQALIDAIVNEREEKRRQKEEADAEFQQNLSRSFSAALKIGASLYTRDYSSITSDAGDLAGSVMKMLGYEGGESFLNWNYKIYDAIQELSKKIDALSQQITDMEANLTSRINSLSTNLETSANRIIAAIVDAETKTRFTQSLSLFQSAKANWDSFVNGAYVPLQNRINGFVATYTEYFGAFLDACYRENGATVTLYYNEAGAITLPRNDTDYDLMGKKIVKKAEVAVPLPEKTFERYNQNKGKAYYLMDVHIFEDLIRQGMDASLAEDVILQLRLLASKEVFGKAEEVRDYFDTYLNFTNYLTGQSMEGVDSTNAKPIEVYLSLLSSVYNFGFEVEDEVVAIICRLGRTFYSASMIADMASLFARNDTYAKSLAAAEETVGEELTTQGRTHPNIGNKFYCLDAATYAEFVGKELMLKALFKANTTEKYGEVEAQDSENPDYKCVDGTAKVYLDGEEISLSAIEENSLSLSDFMIMKIKYANNIAPLYENPLSFGAYLLANGLINDPGRNVVFSASEILVDTLTPANDPTYDLYMIGNRHSDNYGGEIPALYSEIPAGEDLDATLNATTKVCVTGQAASFDTPLYQSSDYILGAGYTYQSGDDNSFSLSIYASHPEYVFENNAIGDFVSVGGYIDNEIHNENGYSYSFNLYDMSDVYLLLKTKIDG